MRLVGRMLLILGVGGNLAASAAAPGRPAWSPVGRTSYETIWVDPLPEGCEPACEELCPSVDSCNDLPPCDCEPCCPPMQGRTWMATPGAASTGPDAPWGAENAAWCNCYDIGPDTPRQSPWEHGWLDDLSIFGGIHGFKGPMDLGRNGNFGFHEGMNFGAPLGLFNWGWQAGFMAVHSNLSGDSTLEDRSAARNQLFVTGGLFKRVTDWGFQWGVTYDWLHDEYYAKADLKQIRSDTSFLFPGGVREIGYFGAYGTGGADYVVAGRQLTRMVFMEPTDIFAFYYRRYFDGGGDGRFWLGWSGRGDGVLGGEICVPMGHGWALENRVNYLIPKQGRGAEGSTQESWGVTIQLVWYPGQPARCARYHPYRPMLSVADNTLFMTDTFVPQ